MNGEPPGKKIMESRNRGLVTPDEQFMITLVEKGLFTVDKTVRYVPSGSKIRAIGKIVESCGCKLVASF